MLDVATTNTDSVNALRAKLGVSGLATELELSLLAVVSTASAGGGPLVTRVTSDTHLVLRNTARNTQQSASNILHTMPADEHNPAPSRSCENLAQPTV